MTMHQGYLLIADISGYTAYLTSSELDHAAPILRSLLTSLVEQIDDPLHLWGMEGDAVTAYTTHDQFPDGETFLAICENFYNVFTTRRRNIIANTTCDCRACANVNDLDLKMMAHHGTFEEIEVGPMKGISGGDVVLVHRMAKTDVKEVTGIASYALFSDAATKAMNVDAALVPFSQSFEHFGKVPMQVYDLAKAWESFHSREERHFLSESEGVWTYRRQVPFSQRVTWEALVSPEMKRNWMRMLSVSVDRPEGRIGPGSGYVCVHDEAEFRYWVTDWEPFDYFSTRFSDPMREGVAYPETYELKPTDTGTEIRYTMGPALDADGNRHEESEADAIAFLSEFWPQAFGEMEALIQSGMIKK